jgi:hypothetical protein
MPENTAVSMLIFPQQTSSQALTWPSGWREAMTCVETNEAVGHSPAITFLADSRVAAISAGPWALETNPASKAEGAR